MLKTRCEDFLMIGIIATLHHKLVNGEWYTPEQKWFECHGKMGIILISLSSLLLLVLTLHAILCLRDLSNAKQGSGG